MPFCKFSKVHEEVMEMQPRFVQVIIQSKSATRKLRASEAEDVEVQYSFSVSAP